MYGELDPTGLDDAIEEAGESAGTDVTGGMKGKLLELKQIVELGIDVYILNLTVKHRLRDTLLGRTDVNTHFKAKILDS
jgi:isopentenyl phosphate kinase